MTGELQKRASLMDRAAEEVERLGLCIRNRCWPAKALFYAYTPDGEYRICVSFHHLSQYQRGFLDLEQNGRNGRLGYRRAFASWVFTVDTIQNDVIRYVRRYMTDHPSSSLALSLPRAIQDMLIKEGV